MGPHVERRFTRADTVAHKEAPAHTQAPQKPQPQAAVEQASVHETPRSGDYRDDVMRHFTRVE